MALSFLLLVAQRDQFPGDVLPGDAFPGDVLPGDVLPVDRGPRERAPVEVLPGDRVPREVGPRDRGPRNSVRIDATVEREVQPDEWLTVDERIDRARKSGRDRSGGGAGALVRRRDRGHRADHSAS